MEFFARLLDQAVVGMIEVADKHKAQPKTVKGIEKLMCPVCKVVAPCQTSMDLIGVAEGIMATVKSDDYNDKLDAELQASVPAVKVPA